MIYSKGISWLDDTRIPFVDTEGINFNYRQNGKVYGGISLLESKTEYTNTNFDIKGRFTPNLLLCDDVLNDGGISKSGSIKPHKQKNKTTLFNSEVVTGSFNGDKGSNSRYYDIDLWFNQLLNKLDI